MRSTSMRRYPTMRNSARPSRKSISVGTMATPNMDGVTGFASTSSLATFRVSASSSARVAMLGARPLQVEFHSAQKKTRTGRSDSITSVLKVVSVTVTGAATARTLPETSDATLDGMAASSPSAWAPLTELMAVMAGRGRRSDVAPLLADESADPGLFGPDSVTWRVAREPFLVVGGGRALLMQVANPLVAQGVVDHSGYETDPFGRLVRTVRWLVAVAFGTKAEARAASATVMRVHATVRGSLAAANRAPGLPAGTAYSALDPDLARWLLATIVR